MKKIIRLLDSTVNFAVLTSFVLIFSYGCYALWDSGQVFQAASAEKYEVYKPTVDDSLSFEELQAVNPEIIGWLTVDGTHIDYPFTQGKDNHQYINTNVEGEYSLAGSIFLDYRNQKDFSDFNSILYGHHMAENAMFGDLADFKDQEFFDGHRYGKLYFDGKNHQIEFFAFLEVDAYDSRIYDPAIPESERQEYLDRIFREALHRREIQIGITNHLILLSTCTSEVTNGRHVLVGRIDGVEMEGGRE